MPFTPSSLAGYQWGVDCLNAFTDTGCTVPAAATGDAIKGLLDLSGNGRNAAYTSGNTPKYQLWNGNVSILVDQRQSGIGFATGSFLDSTYDTSLTLYLVFEHLSQTNLEVLLEANGTVFFVGSDTGVVTSSTERLDWFTNGAGNRYTQWPEDQRAVAVMRFDGANKYRRIVPANGSGDSLVTSDPDTSALGLSGPLTLFSFGGSFDWNGFFYAAHLYNSAHNTTDIQSMVTYLAARHLTNPAPLTRGTGTGNTVVVCDGDSLTFGVGGTSYPSQLATLLGGTYTVTDVGVTGQTAGEVDMSASVSADPSYSLTAHENIYVLWAGTNNLFYGQTTGQTLADITDNVNRRLALGWQRVILLTILSRSGSGTPANFNTERAVVNPGIQALASQRVQVINLSTDPNIGFDGAESNLTYFSTDLTHLNTTGYAIIANDVLTAINNPPPPPPPPPATSDTVPRLPPAHPRALAGSLPRSLGYPYSLGSYPTFFQGLPNVGTPPPTDAQRNLNTARLPFYVDVIRGPWQKQPFVTFIVPPNLHVQAPLHIEPQTQPLAPGRATVVPGPWNGFGLGRSIGLANLSANPPPPPPPPFVPPPPPPPPTTVIGGSRQSVPLIPRAPRVDDNPTRVHTEKVSVLLNSLLRQGFIRQTGDGEYTMVSGAFVLPRAPVGTDDSSVGAVVGGFFINSLDNSVWINVNNSIGSAVWVKLAKA